MAENLNVNGNPNKWTPAQEFKVEPPEDMEPFYEEITICKTEVKEEVYDVEAPIDNVEFMTVKEEYISLPEKNFKEESLEVVESREQFLSEDFDLKKYEFREADHQRNTYRCEQCDSDFDKEILLNRHYEQCSLADQKLLKKPSHLQCNTVEQNTLKKQTLTKRSGEQKKYKCRDCEYSTNMKTYLVRHTRRHANEKPFKCTFKNYKDCNYSTYIKANLIRHTRIHTNEKPFKCTYRNCNCTPEQEDSCKCDTCGYAAVQQSHLRVHILMKHSGKRKQYKCSHCKYSTNIKTYLERHTRTHTHERPFKCTYKNCNCAPEQEDSCQCDTCGYAALQKSNLRVHISRKHSGKQKNASVVIASVAFISNKI